MRNFFRRLTTFAVTFTLLFSSFAIAPFTASAESTPSLPSDGFSSISSKWTTDRFEPDGFLSTAFDGGRRLEIQIGPSSATAQRSGSYKDAFYDTQGRQRTLDVKGVYPWKASAKLYISDDMLSGNTLRRTDLWITTKDNATGDVSGYPIIGMRRFDPADARNPKAANISTVWRWYNSNDGTWTNSDTKVTAGWHTLAIVGFKNQIRYLIDGKDAGGYTLLGDADKPVDSYPGTVTLQAYNFGEAADTDESDVWTDGSKDYSVYWDDFKVEDASPAYIPVDASWKDGDTVQLSDGSWVLVGYNGFKSIGEAIAAAKDGDTIKVAEGTYNEDVVIGKTVTLKGAGAGKSVIVGPKDGTAQTVDFKAPGATVDGFTITRDGNNTTDWATNKNAYGVNFEANGCTLQNCTVADNRNGIYMYGFQNIKILNNTIESNRTGMQICRDITGLVVKNNTIINNYTSGVMFNSYTTGTIADFSKNAIYGNWLGQIKIKRSRFTSAPDLSGNWFGTTHITKDTNAAEDPSYNTYIPEKYGGTATKPAVDAAVLGAVYADDAKDTVAAMKMLDVYPWYKDADMTTLVEPDYIAVNSQWAANVGGDYVQLPNDDWGVIGENAFASVADAVKAAKDGDTVKVFPGDYALNPDSTWKAGDQTGWYLPITQNNLKLIGVDADGKPIAAKPGKTTALPLIYGKDYTDNGIWSSQDLVAVFGDGVTITGLEFMPKSEINKTIELLGKDPVVKYCRFAPNTKIDVSNVKGTDCTHDGGSLYINGGTLTESDVTIEDNYFLETLIAMDSTDFTGGIGIKGNTFDTPEYDTDVASGEVYNCYMIGNTTWETPPAYNNCDVTVEGNSFINLPDGYALAIRHRMNGKFILRANFMEGDDLARVTYDYARYGNLKGSIYIDTMKDDSGNIVDVKKTIGAPEPVSGLVVDATWAGTSAGTFVNSDGCYAVFGTNAFATINSAIAAAKAGDTITVAAGTYKEDVLLNKAVTLKGAGVDQSIISGVKGGSSTTLDIAATGAVVDGFTITREGNTAAEWNDTTLNSQGVAFNGNGNTLKNCKVYGNRNGVYINNRTGNKILGNTVVGNRTGFQICNIADGTVIEGNRITDNYTMGILFNIPDGSPAVPDHGTLQIHKNTISGNWYGEVKCRWTDTINHIDMTDNYFGTADITRSATAVTEPGYAGLIPPEFGGTAVKPTIPVPTISDTAYQLIDVYPWYTDAAMQTLAQPDYIPVNATWTTDGEYVKLPDGNWAIVGQNAFATIAKAVDAATAGKTVWVFSGTYNESVTVNKAITLKGSGADSTFITGTGKTGSGIVIGADGVTVTDLTVSGYNYGFNIGSVKNAALKNVVATGNTAGVKIPSSASVDGLTVDGSKFDNNDYGLYADTSKTDKPDLKNVQITNSEFIGNGNKAFYVEKLSDALFKDVTFTGETDLNLKYKDYANITFENCTVTATGKEYTTGTGLGANGLLVKGRNDGSYASPAGSLSGLTIKGGSFISAAGYKALSIGNAVTGIQFVKNGTANVQISGPGAGLVLYTVTAAKLDNIDFDGNLASFIMAAGATDIDATGTGLSFGGLKDAAAIEAKMFHKPDDPTLGFITWDAAAQTVAALSGITTSAGNLTPAFDTAKTDYAVNLDYKTDATTLTATAASVLDSVTIDGKAGPSANIAVDKGASVKVTIQVTAQNGTKKDYTVTVSRDKDGNADLSGLTATAGTLSPAFYAGTASYTLTLDKAVASTTITAAAASATSTITADGVAGASKTVTLANGASQKVVFVVTAADGSKKTYDVTVKRGSYGSFVFTAKDQSGNAIPGVTIGLYKDAALTALVKQSVTGASGSVTFTGLEATTYYMNIISVPKGYTNTNGKVAVTAKDGQTITTEFIIEKPVQSYKNWQLKGLKVSAGKLSPAFDPSTMKYTLKLDEKTGSVTITPTKADSASTFYINGRNVKSLKVSLKTGETKTVLIKVKPKSGSAHTYTITVSRAKSTDSTIKTLKVSTGKLNPAFKSSVTAYALPISKYGVRLSIKLANTSATYSLKVNGKSVTSRYIHLDKGTSKTVVITVKAQDRKVIKTYTVVIKRAK